ncbi:MAG: trypsin-like peptidase domain-containing protein [Pirellulales bacterium]|nr:trypsin-like peptidase domain-containing protein [Pirellulales bacterium]
MRIAVSFLFFALVTGTVRGQGTASDASRMVALLERTLIDTIARAEPSVVAVSRIHITQPRQLLGRPDPLEEFRTVRPVDDPTDPDFLPTAFGAGVVLDARGLILTHVELVAPGDIHWVTTSDQRSYAARLIGADPRCGLAVLAIDKSGLTPIAMGDASQITRGQLIVVLGNPFSLARDGQASATWGMIANTGRKARLGESQQRATIQEYGGLIQTDAKINVGTSGGPVLNLQGQMIGLTTTLAVGPGFEQSAGYAIGVDALFLRALERLKHGREVEYGHLGVIFSSIAPRWQSVPAGVPIAEAVFAAPAHQAGIQAGDIVTHVNDSPVADADDLIFQVGCLEPNTKTTIRIYRGRRSQEVPVVLSKSPVKWQPIVTNPPPPWRGLRVDYSTAVENYDHAARTGLIDERGCVAIRDVEENSRAWRAGLRAGMFISHVQGNRVRQPEDFRSATAHLKGAVTIRLTLPENQQPERIVPEGG